MTNTLTKEKTLTEYKPAVTARAGVPGRPAIPARAVSEVVPQRTEVPASAMEVLFGAPDRITGEMVYSTSRTGRATKTLISSPLVKLREFLRRPGLTAAQAHYSEVLGLVEINGDFVLMPLTWTSAWVEEARWVTTILPAQPAVAAIPAVIGSPEVFTYDMHLGWNAGAHSDFVIEPKTNCEIKFTLGRNIGAVAGLARASAIVGKTRRSGYGHIVSGVIMSEGRVRMIRDGRIDYANVVEDADVEAFRCVLIDGVCQWFHGSALVAIHTMVETPIPSAPAAGGGGNASATPPPAEQRYVLDATLYAGDDYIDSPSIAPRAPTPGTMELVAKMLPMNVRASGGIPSYAGLALNHMALRAGDAYSDAVMRMPVLSCAAWGGGVGRAALALRPVRAVAGTVALGIADLRLAPMTLAADIDGDAWVPTYGIGSTVLHPMVLGAVMLSGGIMGGDLQLQPLWSRMSESVFGEAILGLEPMQLLGGVTTGTGTVDMIERLLPINDMEQLVYITVVIAERVRGKDSARHQLLAVVSMLEQLETKDPTTVAQSALALLLEQVGAMGPTRALTFRIDDGGWSLVDDSEGWAVNTETSGSSRYVGFGFDSFATVKGRHIGVRSDGVYLLEGDTDAGQPIHAGVHLGLQDFGTSQLKSLSNVYLGVSATGGLFIKVGVGDGDEKLEYTYAARRVDAHLATQRFDLGRGLRSNYFSFELVNDGQADFELEKIEFVAVASNRRI